MSLQYIRDYYQVPAEVGRRVEVRGKGQGTITGAVNAYVEIRLDGAKNALPYHPTDGITYLEEFGKLPKLTRGQERYQRYLKCAECFDSFLHFLNYEKHKKNAV